MYSNQIFNDYKVSEEFAEFSKCTFRNCNFAKATLIGFEFEDCTFELCDFSMTVLDQVVLSNAKFLNCKILGVDFDKCSKYSFSANFVDCILNYAYFHKVNLKSAHFEKCAIKEAVFSESDLTNAVFADCDLADTSFNRCNLSNCDFRSAQNYKFDPSENKVRNAKFAYPSVSGLLSHFQIVIE